jgi:hypothetical protein
MKRINILYKGRKIYQDLTHEECADILQDLALKYFEGDDTIDPNEIDMEEIDG